MANVTTIARPYAKAILALAAADNTFAKWTAMLQCLADIAKDQLGKKLLSNLAVAPADKAQFVCEIAHNVLNAQGENLVKLLAKRKRLMILPELFNLYEVMRKKAEKLITINLTVAQDISPEELNTIEMLCSKNFAGTVILSEQVNNELISGGTAQIGNRVIDASITGRLQAMRNLLRK